MLHPSFTAKVQSCFTLPSQARYSHASPFLHSQGTVMLHPSFTGKVQSCFTLPSQPRYSHASPFLHSQGTVMLHPSFTAKVQSCFTLFVSMFEHLNGSFNCGECLVWW